MPEIKPLKAIHLDTNKVDIKSAVAPPYDVISPSLREELCYIRNFYNIAWLTIPQGNGQDKYTVASDIFTEWQKDGILIQDKEPAIYVYEQEFDYKGEKKILSGFIAICKLEDLKTGSIKPHEQTFPKH